MASILVVDCYVEGDGSANFRRLLGGRQLESWRALFEPRPQRISDYEAIVISGSAACVTAPEPWMDAVVDVILEAKVADIPLLGICFGHQIMAYALFGMGSVRKSSTPEIGWTDIIVSSEVPLLKGLGHRFNTFVSHFDEVVACAGMTVFAHSDRCEVHGYRVDSSRMWGVQFHPEMAESEAVELTKIRIQGRPDLGFKVDEKLAEAKDSTGLATQIFNNFLAMNSC